MQHCVDNIYNISDLDWQLIRSPLFINIKKLKTKHAGIKLDKRKENKLKIKRRFKLILYFYFYQYSRLNINLMLYDMINQQVICNYWKFIILNYVIL